MYRLPTVAVTFLAIVTLIVFSPQKPTEVPEIQGGKTRLEEKMAPADHLMLQRSYPDLTLDVRAYEAALKQTQAGAATAKTQAARIGNTPWRVEGPGNIGGRINAIAIDPNDSTTILVGCAAGGIFKTTNSGFTWDPIFDGAAYLGIGDITFEPGNSQVIYVGTGDPNISGLPVIGDGLYKSTDGGSTWANIGLADTRIISRVIVDPNDVNKIYVAAMGLPMQRNNDRGLYITTDGGQSWTQSLFVADQAGIIDLQMDPSNSQVLYASSWDRIRTNQESTVFGSNAKVWKTTDGGGTWNPLGNGLPNTPLSRVNLSIDAANPSTVYACYVDTTYNVYGIYKTTNAGSNWAAMDISTMDPNALGGFGWYFGNIFANPYQSNEIYVLGVQLWRTTDDGNSWSEADPSWWNYQVHADKHDIVFTGPNSFYLATDGGMYFTSDDGISWIDVEFIPNTQFYRVQVSPHQSQRYFGGAQDNGTTAGNASMINSWPRIFGGDGFQVLFTSDPDEMIVETQNGNLYYSDDGGNYFNSFDNGLDPDDRRNWDMPITQSPSNPLTFYTGTYRIYRSTNPLSSHGWQVISPDLTDGLVYHPRFHNITAIAESPLNNNLIYAGTSDGNVSVTSNGGSNWTNVSVGLPKRYVTSVKASPHLADEVLVTVSGYKYNDFIPHVLHSTNQGASWVDVSGDLPQIALNDVLFHPNLDSVWVVASDGGVYVTQNFGQQWTRVGNNMPSMAVYDMEWDQTLRQLIAGTHARSMMSFPMDSLVTGEVFVNVVGQVEAPKFTLYPNPASEYLVLDAGQGLVEWAVVDMQGRVLREGENGNREMRIDVADLPKGKYLLRIQKKGAFAAKVFSLQ